MLHKKLGEKIAETVYFDEFGPGTIVEGPPIFVQIAQIPTFCNKKPPFWAVFLSFSAFFSQ
jgi:hypothetical protein